MSRIPVTGALTAAAILLASMMSGCSDVYQADPLYAARADSSAAGYDVENGISNGPGPTRPIPRRVDVRSERLVNAAGAGAAAGATPAVTGNTPANGSDTARRAISSGEQLDSERSDGDSSRTTIALRPDSTRDARASDSARDARTQDAATLPAELLEAADDSIVVNTFLAYNPRARTVWVDVIAGYDGGNGALNFNGGFEGAHTLVIPIGWRVEVRFANRDRELSHSASVVPHIDPIPLMVPPAAFPNAFTVSLEQGLSEGRNDEIRFSADTRGRYLLVCAVPGHAEGGMWVGVEVSATATAPEYRRR